MKQLLFILLLIPIVISATVREISKQEYQEAVAKNSVISLSNQKSFYQKVSSGIPLTPDEQTTWSMLQETNKTMNLYMKQIKSNS